MYMYIHNIYIYIIYIYIIYIYIYTGINVTCHTFWFCLSSDCGSKKKNSLEHTTHIRDKCHARHMIRMLIIVSLSKTKKPYNTLPTYGINVPRNT